MSFSAIVFYRGSDGSGDGQTNRYLLVFPDREAADTLYRGLHEYTTNSQSVIREIDRLSPQMWTYQATTGEDFQNLIRAVHKGDPAVVGANDHLKHSRGRNTILHVWNDDSGYVWTLPHPLLHGTKDHIHGDTFCIRNVRDRSEFWWDNGAEIHVSREKRSVFKIEIDRHPELRGPIVIVGDDRVKLSVFRDGLTFPVTLNGDGRLYTLHTRGHRLVFPFNALKTSFELSNYATGEKHAALPIYNEEDEEMRPGEVWELC